MNLTELWSLLLLLFILFFNLFQVGCRWAWWGAPTMESGSTTPSCPAESLWCRDSSTSLLVSVAEPVPGHCGSSSVDEKENIGNAMRRVGCCSLKKFVQLVEILRFYWGSRNDAGTGKRTEAVKKRTVASTLLLTNIFLFLSYYQYLPQFFCALRLSFPGFSGTQHLFLYLYLLSRFNLVAV